MHCNPVFSVPATPEPERVSPAAQPSHSDAARGSRAQLLQAFGAPRLTRWPRLTSASPLTCSYHAGAQIEHVLRLCANVDEQRSTLAVLRALLHTAEARAVDSEAAAPLASAPSGSADSPWLERAGSEELISPAMSNAGGLHRVMAALVAMHSRVAKCADGAVCVETAAAADLARHLAALQTQLDVAQREVQSFQDVASQQQDELTVQWQEKQRSLQVQSAQAKHIDELQAKLHVRLLSGAALTC